MDHLARGLALIVSAAVLRASPAAGHGLLASLQRAHWGESTAQLMHEFRVRATRLPWRLDFGDSYSDVVLRDQKLGGVPVIVYFQMSKKTHGLKRMQIERPRHGVNPPAVRAVLHAIEAAYGAPENHCLVPPRLGNGFQLSATWSWQADGERVDAIFRDTTIEAVEGCLGEAPMPCGLTGQFVVRISPVTGGATACAGP